MEDLKLIKQLRKQLTEADKKLTDRQKREMYKEVAQAIKKPH